MLQKYCIALEDIVYWAQLSARAAPRRTGPDTGQDKMLREGKIMVTSLYQSLCNMETIYADHVAIRYYDEAKQGVTEVYYRQYAQDLRRFVAFLRAEYGDVRGKRVAILARNSYQYVICMYGTVIAGAVAVPLNLGKDWDAISYELGFAEPVCILQDGEFAEREPDLAETYGSILKPMDVFAAYEPAEDVTEVEDLSALAFIMFTSGTTGRSKGVMLSQKNLFAAMPAFLNPFDDVRKATGWDTDKFCSLSALPMFHISAMTSLVSWSITGHCINLCNDLKYFYRDIGAMHSEVMAVVPVLLKSLYKDVMKGRRDRLNGLCVLTCGAAMFDPKMLKDLMDKGFFIAQMYGLTETCGDGAWNSSQEEKHLTSVGHVDDSCQYKLEDGELCMRGDPVMLGYYKDPQADLVALSLPDTPETRHLFNAGRMALCKPGAILLNVGRGTAVDGEALAAAVHSGQLSGAGLDVTDPEPLPPEHPLWAEPNVIITPHVTGGFSLPKTLDNIVDIFAHNLKRYAAGQPLDNQMDRRTQYASGARLQSTL